MSSFCTSCGTASSGAAFCTSCGTAMGTVTSPVAANVEAASVYKPTSESPSSEANEVVSATNGNPDSKKKLLLIAAAVVLVLGTGIGSFFVGKSSVDLEKQQKISYDAGLSAGDSAGYDRGYDAGDSSGYERGYKSGKTAGCLDVFSFSDGTFDYMIPYDPNSYYDKYPGSYYTEKSDC